MSAPQKDPDALTTIRPRAISAFLQVVEAFQRDPPNRVPLAVTTEGLRCTHNAATSGYLFYPAGTRSISKGPSHNSVPDAVTTDGP